jgi:uncharacterized protein YutE (UPF0331/DUF86 family)
MARDEYGNDEINKTVEMGRENMKAIPLVKNWCKYIKVEDKSAGLIAEMYQVPTNQKISCPHTTGSFEAANFNWIATDFIIDNCIDCGFHKEVSPNNYGRPVIARHKARLIAEKQQHQEEQTRKNQIKTEIEAVINSVPSAKKTTSLSILKLIQSLDNEVEKDSAPEKILEATKLSPEFFSEAAVDYLSLYFTQECGPVILEAVDHLAENGTEISQFAFDHLVIAIQNSSTLDLAAKIINRLIQDTELEKHKSIFESILDNCEYDDSIGRRHLTDVTYTNAARLFKRLFESNDKPFHDILETKLKNDEKSSRINCCGFLINLMAIDPKMIIPHTPLLIKSFEFKEDRYGNSADSATREVLKNIYLHDSKVVIDSIDKLYDKISTPAKVEILKFYSKLLGKTQDLNISEIESAAIIQKLVNLLLKGTTDEILKEKLLDAVKDISDARPLEFIAHFDALLGFLVVAHQDLARLIWNIEDLDNVDRPALSFNPLIGKNFYEIESLKIRAQKAISIAQDIIENIIKENPDDYYDKVLKIIIGLESKKEHALKTSLIDILRESLKDTLNVSQLLPNIHSFIHDIDSEAVRDAGMKYLVHIIEKHPQIVTQTFIDTIKIFLNDPIVLIRGRAIEAYGAMIRTLPAHVDSKELDVILDCILDKYVFIHKQAAKLSYKLYPFLDESRLNKLALNLIGLENYYYDEKDFHYCRDIIDSLLFITKGRPKFYSQIVTKILVKNCNTKDYYSELNAIEKLTSVTTEFKEFESVWMPNAINFLLHTFPESYNQGMDARKKLFAKMYDIKPAVLIDNMELFTAFIKDRIDKSIFGDVKDAYSILAFFCCYTELITLTEHFLEIIPSDASRQYIHSINAKTNTITLTELSAEAGFLDIPKLKIAIGI